VSSLFSSGAFAGFGPNRLATAMESAAIHGVEGLRPRQLRVAVREACPRRPGVYGMIDGAGELIYIGKAKSLRARLLSYFRTKGRNRKTTRIIRVTRAIVWEHADCEFAALLRELELIRRWRPRFNVQGQPQRFGRAFVCLGRRPAPYVFLARRAPAGIIGCWGPLYAGRRAKEAVRRLNDWFGLRDCPQAQQMIFAEQVELFEQPRTAACIRHELGTCLGPCAALCTRSAYLERVQAARRFLDGTDLAPLDKLQADMLAASQALAFERAAGLHEKRQALAWLQMHLQRLREIREKCSFIYRAAGQGGREIWYLLRRGWVAAALPEPTDAASQQRATETIATVFRKADPWTEPLPAEEMAAVLLVSAWFRRHPQELTRTAQPEMSDPC